jgi:hypothetical protein
MRFALVMLLAACGAASGGADAAVPEDLAFVHHGLAAPDGGLPAFACAPPTATPRIEGEFPVPLDGFALAIDPWTRRLFLAGVIGMQTDRHVLVLDADTGATVHDLSFDALPTTLAVNPETGGLYVGLETGVIRVFDRDLTLIDEIATRPSFGQPRPVFQLVPDVPQNRLYVNPQAGDVQVFLCDADREFVHFPGPAPARMALDLAGQRIWIASLGGTAQIFETLTFQQFTIATIGSTITDIAFDEPLGLAVIVGATSSGPSVSVLDRQFMGRTIMSTFELGNVVIDPCAHRAFISNTVGGIDVVDELAITFVASLVRGGIAGPGVYDPATGSVLVVVVQTSQNSAIVRVR